MIGDLQRPRIGAVNGSTVAAVGWVEALRNTRLAEACDLFAPTLSPSHDGRGISHAPADGIHILPLACLPDRLATHDYDVVHDVRNGHRLSILSWLAGAHSRKQRPVVSAVHYALNFPAAVIGAMQTLIYGVSATDGLACLSTASMAAQRRLFDDVEQQLHDIGIPTRSGPALFRIPFGI